MPRWCFEMIAPDYVTQAQMRDMLRELYARDVEKSVLGAIARSMKTPAGEIGGGRRRASPWLTLAWLVAALLGIFAFFTLVPMGK